MCTAISRRASMLLPTFLVTVVIAPLASAQYFGRNKVQSPDAGARL